MEEDELVELGDLVKSAAPLQTEHLFDERPFKTVRARRRLHRPCEAPRCRRRAGGVLGSTGGRDSPISPPRVAQLVSVSCFNMNGYGPQLADVNACTAEFEANAREAAAASSKLAAVAPAPSVRGEVPKSGEELREAERPA